MKKGTHTHAHTHTLQAHRDEFQKYYLSQRSETQKTIYSGVHLREIQELANLIYGDRDQNNHCLWEVAEGIAETTPKNVRKIKMFYSVIWALQGCIHMLKSIKLFT